MVAITPTPDELGLLCDVTISGLTPGTRYDVLRRHMTYNGDDTDGTGLYSMPLPDRESNWSSVAHRVAWAAPNATVHFRDYEPPLTPFSYFIVESDLVGPPEWDFDDGDYPLGRGTLDDQIVHINYLLTHSVNPDTGLIEERHPSVVIRSTADLGLYVESCIFDFQDLKYQARGTEMSVMRQQYPVYVADTREARRGSIILAVNTLDQYDEVRNIVFPSNGRMRPIRLDVIGNRPLLLDNVKALPLDVSIEQATKNDPDLRYVTVDFIEIGPMTATDQRSGDNDDLVNRPQAAFALSDTTPAKEEQITLTDTSTGQYDHWRWSVERGSSNKNSVFHGVGPHKLTWHSRGPHKVKLRVWGPVGASVITRTVTVH